MPKNMLECKFFVQVNFLPMWNMLTMCALCFYQVIHDITLNEIEPYSTPTLLFGKMNLHALLE